MEGPADLRVADGVVAISGPWTLPNLVRLDERVRSARLADTPRIDASGLTALDTAGAMLLLRALPGDQKPQIDGLRAADRALLDLVATRLGAAAPPREPNRSLARLLARVGAAMEKLVVQARDLLGFIGLTLATLAAVFTRRRKLRLTSTVFHMEEVGLDAVPIIALLTFLVGAVVAFVGASALRNFGAQIFVVELVGVSYLREFGVLLTAILVAGRSGSAFTAQIGSMKSREELDAIEALGLDAIELLVLPRLLALLVMLPVLAFIAMIMGVLGGMVVSTLTLDITTGMYLSRLHEMVEIHHFWVGMVKAPIFAFLIAVVGCLEGFKVEGSAESVGRHTTSSVVQAIFLVIVFDAFFAMFFMEMDW